MPFLRRRPPPSPSLTATLTGHGRAVNAAGFSPDGRLLASGCADWTVILWDVTDPARAAQRAALTHPGPGGGARPSRRGSGVRAAGFSPDGRLLASGNADKTVILWDVTDPVHPARRAALTHPPPGPRPRWGAEPMYKWDAGVNAVGFSPDGRLLACGCDGAGFLWDVTDLAHPAQRVTVTHSDRSGAIKAVGFSVDGRLLATGAADAKNPAVLWDVADPERPARLATIRPPGRDWGWKEISTVNAVGFSPGGRLLAVGSGEENSVGNGVSSSRGAVALWDVTDLAHPVRTAIVRAGVQVHAVAFSPDGRLLASGNGGATVILWDVTDPAHLAAAATLTTHHCPSGDALFPSPQKRPSAQKHDQLRRTRTTGSGWPQPSRQSSSPAYLTAGRRAPLRGLALITQGRPHPPAHRFRALARCCLRAVGDWGMDCSCRPVRCSRCRFLPGPVAGVCLWMRSVVDLRLALGAVGDPGAGGLCGIGEVPLADVLA